MDFVYTEKCLFQLMDNIALVIETCKEKYGVNLVQRACDESAEFFSTYTIIYQKKINIRSLVTLTRPTGPIYVRKCVQACPKKWMDWECDPSAPL